jgi:hypothetical protein
MKHAFFAVAVALSMAGSSRAQIIISEIHPSGSAATTPYVADFFEMTNIGAAPVNITGWTMDDSSAAFATSAPLAGVTAIQPGQSVIFLEGDGSNIAAFQTAWFGGSPPPGFAIGSYAGAGIGLSTTGDGVVIFDSAQAGVTGVSFGAATTGVTFDNAAGLGSTSSPFPSVTTLSAAGVNNAILSPANETGSPGAVPEPSSLGLAAVSALLALRRRKKIQARLPAAVIS